MTESLLDLLYANKDKKLCLVLFKRASFLKLEVIMNQTRWEKNIKQKI